jgi:hypothetical protein
MDVVYGGKKACAQQSGGDTTFFRLKSSRSKAPIRPNSGNDKPAPFGSQR